MVDIIREADVSVSTFQNIFRSKDGVLLDLVDSMFDNQYATARRIAQDNATPALLFAIETSIQLTLTELSDNIREVYVETYSHPQSADAVYQKTAYVLHELLGSYQPECSISDFYEMEIGTAGLMRNYMVKKCGIHFPFETKLKRFLTAALRVYTVPEEDLKKVLAFIEKLDIKAVATEIMEKLFAMLEMKYDFKLSRNIDKE